MATGLTLTRLSEDQCLNLSPLGSYSQSRTLVGSPSHKNLYKGNVDMEDATAADGQAPGRNPRSPWIRLFKLFQSKQRAEAQQQAVNSSKVKQRKERSSSSVGLTVEVITKAAARKNSKEEEQKVKRNIYRRPSSRAILSPHNVGRGSIGETGYTQQYSRRKSDPVDEACNAIEHLTHNDNGYDPYENPGRFARPRSCSVPAICPGSGVRRRLELARRPSPRHTNFQQDVSVVYFEEDRQSSGKRLCENATLNDIHEVSQDDGSVAGPSQPETEGSDSNEGQDANNADDCKQDQPPRIVITPGGCQSIDVPPTFNIGRSRGGVRLMIELDKECLRKRTSVKAMSGGQTLIVLTYNPVSGSDTEVKEHSSRINLPVTIDPFSVKANVLKSGHLCIEAPLRKDSI